jgi:hypothetical protein
VSTPLDDVGRQVLVIGQPLTNVLAALARFFSDDGCVRTLHRLSASAGVVRRTIGISGALLSILEALRQRWLMSCA